VDGENAIFDFRLINIQWFGWRTTDHFARRTEFTIVARTVINLIVLLPVDPATQVGAYVIEYGNLASTFIDDVNSKAINGFFPTIDFCAGKIKQGGSAYRIIFEWTQGNPRFARLDL
jgi:hypothetical protein